MEFDLLTTAAVFIAAIAVGVGVLIVSEVMPVGIVLGMVLPSMVFFGLFCLFLGMKYGRHRIVGE
jgi:hypothetical protein